MVEEGVEVVAVKEGLSMVVVLGEWREERRVEMVFQRFRAADSAARIVSLSAVEEVAREAVMELVEMRAFWSLIRVFRRESKVFR